MGRRREGGLARLEVFLLICALPLFLLGGCRTPDSQPRDADTVRVEDLQKNDDSGVIVDEPLLIEPPDASRITLSAPDTQGRVVTQGLTDSVTTNFVRIRNQRTSGEVITPASTDGSFPDIVLENSAPGDIIEYYARIESGQESTPVTKVVPHLSAMTRVNTIVELDSSHLLLGTNGGLIRYDLERKSYDLADDYFSFGSGFIGLDIHSVLAEEEGWFVPTRHGLYFKPNQAQMFQALYEPYVVRFGTAYSSLLRLSAQEFAYSGREGVTILRWEGDTATEIARHEIDSFDLTFPVHDMVKISDTALFAVGRDGILWISDTQDFAQTVHFETTNGMGLQCINAIKEFETKTPDLRRFLIGLESDQFCYDADGPATPSGLLWIELTDDGSPPTFSPIDAFDGKLVRDLEIVDDEVFVATPEGIFRWNPQEPSLVDTIPLDGVDYIARQKIMTLTATRSGELFAGIHLYGSIPVPHNLLRIPFPHSPSPTVEVLPNVNQGLPSNAVDTVTTDCGDYLWVSTDSGLAVVKHELGSLQQTHWNGRFEEVLVLSDCSVIAEKNPYGLARFDEDPFGTQSQEEPEFFSLTENIVALAEDETQGRYYALTNEAELYAFDTVTGTLLTRGNVSLENTRVMTVLADGRIVIGGNGLRIVPPSLNFSAVVSMTHLDTFVLESIDGFVLQPQEGILWMSHHALDQAGVFRLSIEPDALRLISHFRHQDLGIYASQSFLGIRSSRTADFVVLVHELRRFRWDEPSQTMLESEYFHNWEDYAASLVRDYIELTDDMCVIGSNGGMTFQKVPKF